MKRLSALDANFLYSESATAHQHTLKVSIVDPTGTPGGYSFPLVKDVLRRRIHRVEPLRWRVLPVPFGLHHPVWVEDPDFDLDYHVRRIAVPAPGGDRELGEVISEIASRPLDRRKPLWELWMIEGLDGGHVASVAKVHHAVADGMASAAMLDRFYDSEPTAAPTPEPPPWQPPPLPSKLSLVLAALVDVLKLFVLGLPTLLRLRRESRAKKAARGMPEDKRPPKFYKAPRSAYNGPVTAHRLFAFMSVDLDEVKQVRQAFGTTINDVVLAMVAGALRRDLEAKGDLPDQPLVGQVPVSTRTEQDRDGYGNKLGTMLVSLPTNVADPVERLRAAHDAAVVSKDEFADTRGARLENWVELWPPVMLRLLARTAAPLLRIGMPAVANVVLSNVPGPRASLYIGGARLHSFFSVGPLIEGMALNITVWSYVDQLNFSLLSCRETVPNVWELTDHLRESLDELKKAAAEQGRDVGETSRA